MIAATSQEPYLAAIRKYLGRRYSAHTVNACERQSAAFLRIVGVKPAYSRNDVLGYVDHLIAGGYRKRSIIVMLSEIRTMFRACGMTWPVDRVDMHLGIAEGELGGVVLENDDVAMLVAASRAMGYPYVQIVALATTWGFRNSELAGIVSAGLNTEVMRVRTAKTGTIREHSIPPQLSEVLRFSGRTISPDGAHKWFDAVSRAAGRAQSTGEGWHAVRRSLVSGLKQNEVDDSTIDRYMGWKQQRTGFIYDRRSPLAIDLRVYKSHPFLSAWEA